MAGNPRPVKLPPGVHPHWEHDPEKPYDPLLDEDRGGGDFFCGKLIWVIRGNVIRLAQIWCWQYSCPSCREWKAGQELLEVQELSQSTQLFAVEYSDREWNTEQRRIERAGIQWDRVVQIWPNRTVTVVSPENLRGAQAVDDRKLEDIFLDDDYTRNPIGGHYSRVQKSGPVWGAKKPGSGPGKWYPATDDDPPLIPPPHLFKAVAKRLGLWAKNPEIDRYWWVLEVESEDPMLLDQFVRELAQATRAWIALGRPDAP